MSEKIKFVFKDEKIVFKFREVINLGGGSGAAINDNTISTSTTWSSAKINTELSSKAGAYHTHSLSDITDYDATTDNKINTAISNHNSDNIAHSDIRNDLANKVDKPSTATSGNIAVFDANKNVVDSGKSTSDFADATHTHTLGDLSNVDTTGATSGQVLLWNGTMWVPANAGTDTKKVLVSSTDTTENFLGAKIVAGTGISIQTLNSGANEQIKISATGGGGSGYTLIASVDVTTDTSSILLSGLNLVPDKEYEIVLDGTMKKSSSFISVAVKGKVNGESLNAGFESIYWRNSSVAALSGAGWVWGWIVNVVGRYGLIRGRLRIVGDRPVWEGRCKDDTTNQATAYSRIITSVLNVATTTISSVEFYIDYGDKFTSGTKLRLYEVV